MWLLGCSEWLPGCRYAVAKYFSNCFVCISVQLQYSLLLLQLWLFLVCCYAIVRVF